MVKLETWKNWEHILKTKYTQKVLELVNSES